MMITIDPRALLTTILIIVTLYFTARDYLLRLTIMSIVVWLIILFRIHQEIPTRMEVSLMDVVLVAILGAIVVVLYSVYRFTRKHKEEERMK